MVPPRLVRRLVLAPAIPLLTVLLVVSLPLTLIAAAVASTFLPGRWRALRVLYLLLIGLVVETVMLVWLFALWVASGFGRRLREPAWQERHYAAMRRYLDVVVRAGTRVFRVGFDVDVDDLATHPRETTTPLIVLARHAGPGDSFLLVHALLRLDRRPRIVLTSRMQWAPAIDIGLNRLPSYFVPPRAPRGTGTAAVRTLAAGMGDGDALIIFPEGRNYTPQRRLLSIDALEEQGRHAEAETAREMRHVLAPRSGGAIAALEGARHADIAFVTHAGLEHFITLADLWRGLPVDADVAVKAWLVPRAELPRAREAQQAWLQWWWRRIDAWLIDHFGTEAVPDAVVEELASCEVEPAPE